MSKTLGINLASVGLFFAFDFLLTRIVVSDYRRKCDKTVCHVENLKFSHMLQATNGNAEYFDKAFEDSYLPDMKTASYCPRPAAIIRCFNFLRDGRTSKAGGSANNYDSNTCKTRNR